MKRSDSCEHLVVKNADTPEISAVTVLLGAKHLGRLVGNSAYFGGRLLHSVVKALSLAGVHKVFAAAQVNDHAFAIPDAYVIGLDIAMGVVIEVHGYEARQNILKVYPRLQLLEVTLKEN